MGKLTDLIDDYKDRNGNPSDRSIARAIGVSGGTISAWRNRGISELPHHETLSSLADFLKLNYEVVFYAARVDAGYIIEREVDAPRVRGKTGG
jgi:transcriptional regulator with XRE-family HTH domain